MEKNVEIQLPSGPVHFSFQLPPLSLPPAPHWQAGGRGVLPIMAYTGGSAQKGYLFQASGI